MTSYVDENGKLHYVNSNTTKVPPQYQDPFDESEYQDEAEFPDEEPEEDTGYASDDEGYEDEAEFPIDESEEGEEAQGTAADEMDEGEEDEPIADETDVGENDLGEKEPVTAEEDPLADESTQLPPAQVTTFRPNQSPVVEIFVDTDCSNCNKLEVALRANRIGYQRYDVEHTPYGKKMHSLLNEKLPFTRIGDEIVSGLNVNAIREIINKNRPTEPAENKENFAPGSKSGKASNTPAPDEPDDETAEERTTSGYDEGESNDF